MNIRAYNKRTSGYKRYTGLNREGKTLTVSAWNAAEAKVEMRKQGFKAIKIIRS